jgi:hypothetical protein
MRDILTDEQRKAGKNRPLGLAGYLPDAALVTTLTCVLLLFMSPTAGSPIILSQSFKIDRALVLSLTTSSKSFGLSDESSDELMVLPSGVVKDTSTPFCEASSCLGGLRENYYMES